MSVDPSWRTLVVGELAQGALPALLDAVDEALLVTDADGRLVAANHRLWHLFGLAPTDSVGGIRNHIVSCVADPDAYLRAVEVAPGTLAPDEGECEFALVRPEPRVVRRRVCSLGAVGWLVSYRDVTRDAEVNRLKTEFVANVSHELRTPMAAVKGFLTIVLEDEGALSAEQRRRFLTIAKAETERLSRLIDDLLDLSRIEAGRHHRLEATFPLAELVRDVVIVARPEATKGEVALAVEPLPEDVVVSADRDQIAQVLHNLVGNAVKFTPAGGSVTLSARADEQGLTLAVQDTGVGIAAEDLPRVFEKFYRCRGSGVAPRGAGLGLAIAQELVEAHDGCLTVSSQPGAGSRFAVQLPPQRWHNAGQRGVS